jgi:prephenate dehydrogenase
MNQIRHIGIIGLGQIGGSLAAALRNSSQFSYKIGALDLRARLEEEALQREIIDYPIDSDLTEINKMDLLILAAPVRAIASMIPAFKRRMAPGSILLDTGSTKRSIVEAMEASEEPVFCFGGHPITGIETSGVDSWQASLFNDRPFVLVRTASSDRGAEDALRELIRDIGGQPVVTDARAHDRSLAVTSHLPLLLANALVAVSAKRLGDDDMPLLFGASFESATRVVRKPTEMIADILATNRDLLAEAYDAFDGEVRRLLGVFHKDVDDIRRELTHSRVARAKFVSDNKS